MRRGNFTYVKRHEHCTNSNRCGQRSLDYPVNMAGDQKQFEGLLQALMSPENETRIEKEVTAL